MTAGPDVERKENSEDVSDRRSYEHNLRSSEKLIKLEKKRKFQRNISGTKSTLKILFRPILIMT